MNNNYYMHENIERLNINDVINVYPDYTLGDDKNFYNNLFLFLKKGIKNGERTWPDYIKNTEDKSELSLKKIQFYSKIGKLGGGKGKRKLENEDERNYKKFEYNNNQLYNNRIINDSITNKKIVKKYRIPKSYEINEILIKAHDKRNHGGIYATTYFINQSNLYWINMTHDIKNHISNCLTYMELNKNCKNSLSTCKTILSKGLRDSYVVDLCYLPQELNSKYTNYKYVLDIYDHFSKYTNSFLLNSKEASEIFPLIKNFMLNNGFPKYLITENGTEFKNKQIKEFCENNHVRFIHGLPYRPHSQVVECIYRIIKKGLLCHKEDLKDKYNINFSIDDVITIKNDTICRVTKKCPNDLFNDENIDLEEIK